MLEVQVVRKGEINENDLLIYRYAPYCAASLDNVHFHFSIKVVNQSAYENTCSVFNEIV